MFRRLATPTLSLFLALSALFVHQAFSEPSISNSVATISQTMGDSEDTGAEEAPLSATEQLGPLSLDLPEAEALKALGTDFQKGKEEFQGADENYVQDWEFRSKGVLLTMGSEKPNSPKTVFSVTITAPSDLKTLKGIGIGSSESEVRKAYGNQEDGENTKKGENFVAGSIYGGVIFTFDKGRVTRIFLGAAAE